MLRTVVLALRYQPGRDVGNTHRGFCTVNVLPTGAGGAVYVNAQVGRVNFDIDIVFDFRVNERGAEGGMTAAAGIERALTHQTMNAGFGTQPAVGVITNDLDGHGFNPCDFTFGFFDDFGLKAARFRPAQVHAHQHAGPVLGFGAAGTGLNIKVAIGAVVFAGEHAAELKLRQLLFQRIQLGDGFVEGLFVVRFHGQIQQAGNVFQPLGHLIQGIYDGFQGRTLFTQRLSAFRFVPDVRLFQLGVYFFETLFLGIVVKDTP